MVKDSKQIFGLEFLARVCDTVVSLVCDQITHHHSSEFTVSVRAVTEPEICSEFAHPPPEGAKCQLVKQVQEVSRCLVCYY